MKRLMLILFMMMGGFYLSAQKGVIKGKVTDAKTGEELLGVVVVIEGTQNAVVTDFTGEYQLQVVEGEFNVEFRYVSYENGKVQKVKVQPGKETILDFKMSTADVKLEEVTVIGKANRQNETMLLMEQKNSTVITQAIGAKELSRKGASNVAAGVSKMSGISMMGSSSSVFVRGMGERYNTVTLNGMPIASPNPDTKLLPLDIFSTQVVENIGVSKVFMPNLMADMSGANIDISTRKFMENQAEIGIGTGGNSNVTGKQLHLSPEFGGVDDYFGMGISKREMPAEIKNATPIYTLPNGATTDPFTTDFGFRNVKAMPELGLSFSGGKKISLHDKNYIGFVLSANVDNDYSQKIGEKNNYSIVGDQTKEYQTREDEYNSKGSALASLVLHTQNNDLSYQALLINSAENFGEENGGTKDHIPFFTRRLTQNRHLLLNQQLTEEYRFNKKLNAVLKASYTNANSDQPDRRTLTYEVENDQYVIGHERSSAQRYFQELNEKELAGQAIMNYLLKGSDAQDRLSVGYLYRNKKRDFESRSFNYLRDDQTYDIYDENEVYFDDVYFQTPTASGEKPMYEVANASGAYDASLMLNAGYADFVKELGKKWLVDLGIRFEASTLEVNYKLERDVYYLPMRKATLDATDFFPALNLKYSPTDKQNIRLGASKTITRPEFKEFSPFPYINSFDEETRGNPELENGYNYNYDLKYEIFPSPTSLFAVSVYGKQLKNPIEEYIKGSSTVIYSYTNTPKATVAGAELEYKQELSSFIGKEKWMSKIYWGMNAAYMYTSIELDEANKGVNTNSKRPLQGASPYIVNADFNVPISLGKNNTLTFSAIYNVVGKRLARFGTDGLEDIYENPINTFDALMVFKTTKRFSMKLSAKNLLNPDIEEVQNINGEEKILKTYQKGISYSMSLSYEF